MRRRFKIIVGVALVALLLLALLLTFHDGTAQHSINVGFTSAHGHFPEPGLIYGDQSTVAWVTNAGHFAVTLDTPCVLFENTAGRLIRDQGPSWNQEGYNANLSPRSAAWLANDLNQDRKRMKFVFEYHRDGGPLLRGISKAVAVLPAARFPQGSYDWLRRNGFVDGAVHGHYESRWFTNASQPLRPETNPTPAVAGPDP
jgi:hypothetical protein